MKLLKSLTLVAAVILSVAAYADGAKWLTSYDEAVKLSKKTGKPIMADFTGSDWCTWCIRLHKEVFDKPEFKAWAEKNVILLELDYPNSTPQPAAIKKQNAGLLEKYKKYVPGYPTILFLDAKGKVLGQYGYDPGGPANWTKKAAAMIKKKAAKA